MTYRELLHLYKQGRLSPEEASRLEQEIEKQDAISEYLYLDSSVPEVDRLFSEEEPPSSSETWQEEEFLRLIRQSVRKAFLKLGASVLALTVLILLFVQFALPDLVSRFYYDPGEEIAEDTSRMNLDMAVYTELTMPAQYRDQVRTDSNGYGSYDLTFFQNISYNGTFTNVSGVLKRNRLTLYDPNVLQKPVSNTFGWYQADLGRPLTPQLQMDAASDTHTLLGISGTPEVARQKLENLKENEMYAAYVTLENLTPYEAFAEKFCNKETSPAPAVWCAPVTGSETSYFRPSNLGFRCSLSSSTSLNWDEQAYPHLLLWHTKKDSSDTFDNLEQETEMLRTEAYAKTHFTSLLRYLSHQETFLDIMDDESDLYREAAEYTEKNPLMIYGFVTLAEKDALLELLEDPDVCVIHTDPLL